MLKDLISLHNYQQTIYRGLRFKGCGEIFVKNYTHKEHGGRYEVVEVACIPDCSVNNLEDFVCHVVYRDTKNLARWIRPLEEFYEEFEDLLD